MHPLNLQSLDGQSNMIILEAPNGQTRRAWMKEWLDQHAGEGTATWLLDGNRSHSGPWAGLNTWMQTLLPDLQQHAPDLITKHDYELTMILPALRRSIQTRNPNLTDSSTETERTRNYAADRAYRIVHGIIDLLDSWYHQTNTRRWYIALDAFDQAGVLVQTFFIELMRRRGTQLHLSLLVSVEIGAGPEINYRFAEYTTIKTITLDIPSEDITPPTPDEMAQKALALEQIIGKDKIELEIHLPQILYYWSHSDQPERIFSYLWFGLAIYTAFGMYADALYYGEKLRLIVEENPPNDVQTQQAIYSKLYGCYTGTNQPYKALEIAERGIELSKEPEHIRSWSYSLAMLYTRFLPERDLAKAEAYLEQGLVAINQANPPEHTRLFQTAFNRNGLALIRHLQGRPNEAITLCQTYFKQLEATLAPNEHKLHRSVLLYNTAQVYEAMRQYKDAIAYYTAAMQMDPNYSEYYNERGNIYQKLDYLAEAEHDYQQAISLSPPYPEVWTNLGQCQLQRGQLEEATKAYTRALDLAPKQVLALIGRGQAYHVLGLLTEALADYTYALQLDPHQPLIWANRAAIHYEWKQLHEALDDLNHAIELNPNLPDLYENRAIAYAALGHQQEAERDQLKAHSLISNTSNLS